MPNLAAYSLMINDPLHGGPVERVHTVNPWHKTSAEGVFPETWNMWPRERSTGEPVRLAHESEGGFLTRIAETYVPTLTTLTQRAVDFLARQPLIAKLPRVGVPVPVHRRIAEHLAQNVDAGVRLSHIPYYFVESDYLLPMRRWRYVDKLSADPEQPQRTVTSHVWECCWRIRDGRVVVDLAIAKRRRRYEILLLRDARVQSLASKSLMSGEDVRPAIRTLQSLDHTLTPRLAGIRDLDVLSSWLPSELSGEKELRLVFPTPVSLSA